MTEETKVRQAAEGSTGLVSSARKASTASARYAELRIRRAGPRLPGTNDRTKTQQNLAFPGRTLSLRGANINTDNAVAPTGPELVSDRVEHGCFTAGGLGNQDITISGEVYVTWFDFRATRLWIGCEVECTTEMDKAFKCATAMILRVAE